MKVKNGTATAGEHNEQKSAPIGTAAFWGETKTASNGNTWMMYAPQSADGKIKELPRIPARMLS